MNGNDFLRFLNDNKYIEEITAKKYENPDLEYILSNMYKTNLFNEELLVGYLNKWGKLPAEISTFENREISVGTDIVEKNRYDEFSKYLIVPIEATFMDGGSLTSGGALKFLVPIKYFSVINTEYLRKNLKTSYQTSAWKINIEYGLTDVCSTLYYKYTIKFRGASLDDGLSHLNLKQKIQKVFRDAIRSNTMDIVFHMVSGEMTVLRKYMNEYHKYDEVRFNSDEILNFKNMLIGNFGGVEAVRVNHEPSLDFKIDNLNEDGKFEGRVNFMDTKIGFEAHIRIIKLEFNEMTLEDYNLALPVRAEVLDALDETMGLILITGARGSGKQVFMYSCINEFFVKKPHSFVETLEDPVEARLKGNIAQIEIDRDNGFDFMYYLRGIKRHSTNLYMFGELRDRETVEAVLTEAASAALIMATTHSPDCAGVLKKMSMELKDDDSLLVKLINEFKVITNLTMTRKACPKCIIQVPFEALTKSQRKFVDSWGYKGKIYKQKEDGCDYCKSENSKRVGQYASDGNLYEPLVIVESLAFTKEIMELINQFDTVTDKEDSLRAHMIANGRYKTQIALGLVNKGLLTIEECMKFFSPNNYVSQKCK